MQRRRKLGSEAYSLHNLAMDTDKFYLEEYKTLKSELLSNVDETMKLEVYAVGSTIAFHAWCASHSVPRVAWFAPLLLWMFGVHRSCSLLRRIEHLCEYIRVFPPQPKVQTRTHGVSVLGGCRWS
jgi:hypothetical protein